MEKIGKYNVEFIWFLTKNMKWKVCLFMNEKKHKKISLFIIKNEHVKTNHQCHKNKQPFSYEDYKNIDNISIKLFYIKLKMDCWIWSIDFTICSFFVEDFQRVFLALGLIKYLLFSSIKIRTTAISNSRAIKTVTIVMNFSLNILTLVFGWRLKINPKII